MHAEATCRLEPIQKKKKRKKKRNSRSIFFCKFYSSILSLRTLPHQFGLKKPTLSLPFASKNASRVLCLYLPLRAFLDLHIACERALPGEWGWGRGREKGNESLHWRLINLNSTPRTPLWLLWCWVVKIWPIRSSPFPSRIPAPPGELSRRLPCIQSVRLFRLSKCHKLWRQRFWESSFLPDLIKTINVS